MWIALRYINKGLNILKFSVGTAFNSHSNKCFLLSVLCIELGADWRQRVKRLLFNLNSLLRQSMLCGTLGLTNRDFFQQFEKITTYEDHEDYVVRIFGICYKISKTFTKQIFVERNDNWEISPVSCRAFHLFCSVRSYIQYSNWTDWSWYLVCSEVLNDKCKAQ
jgi:hypothetical protein